MSDVRPLLEVEDLHVHLRSRDGTRDLHIVDGISFTLDRGETLGIVGESGCGKSTLALAVMGLLPRGGRTSAAQLDFDGVDLETLSEEELRRIRGSRIAMIMQDPMVAMDPLFTIGNQLAEGLRTHMGLEGQALEARQLELLELVGIPAAKTRLGQYPHQMSGGMLQRMVGAIAMSCDPQLLIADEPTTALDPTAQAQFLDVLADLQEQRNLAMIVVTHDFGVTARLADRVLVMYAGIVAEQGPIRAIFDDPRHPYTQALLAAVPREGGTTHRLQTIEGSPPDVAARPQGCPFAPRCPKVLPLCREQMPPPVEAGPGHYSRCWRTDET
jgi:oligopeptide/dipeptide ABC transporter ATP-binding protein